MTKKIMVLCMAILALVIVSIIIQKQPLSLAPIVFGLFVAGVLMYRLLYVARALKTYRHAVRNIRSIIEEKKSLAPHRLSSSDLLVERISAQIRLLETLDKTYNFDARDWFNDISDGTYYDS